MEHRDTPVLSASHPSGSATAEIHLEHRPEVLPVSRSYLNRFRQM